MKEITEIHTIEMTMINDVTDKEAEEITAGKELAECILTAVIKRAMRADDVHVKIQTFVLDKENA